MITILSSKRIDLVEVEKLRKWIEYNPNTIQDNELEKKDNNTLSRIKELYALIKKIDGNLNVKERIFYLKNPHSPEEEREYQKLVDSIPRLNVSYYASIKLTDKEKQFAYNFMKKCNKENSDELMEYAENYPNFFVSSYMVELLRHHPESNYNYSTKNISTTVKKGTKKLTKKLKEIKKREQETWKHARYRMTK